MNRKKVIVITPIRNEEWIIDSFLSVASSYADHIIIGDHHSTDRSVEIAKKYEKVVVFKSSMESFSERERRNELLTQARKFGEGNVIISLDADEFLSPDFVTDNHISLLKSLDVGTRISLPFFNIRPGFEKYWVVPQDPIGFVDDGTDHTHNLKIHFPRVPLGNHAAVYKATGSGIIHLQYVDWHRMESKHLWYRVLERITFPKKSALDIARRYSHMYAVPDSKLLDAPSSWWTYLEGLGGNLSALASRRQSYWWDSETLSLVSKHGPEKFKYIDLSPVLEDWRPTLKEKIFHNYVRMTTQWTGLHLLSPLRLTIRSLDLLVKWFWR